MSEMVKNVGHFFPQVFVLFCPQSKDTRFIAWED